MRKKQITTFEEIAEVTVKSPKIGIDTLQILYIFGIQPRNINTLDNKIRKLNYYFGIKAVVLGC